MEARQIKIPIPQVPKGLESKIEKYLIELRRAVEENLRALFSSEPVQSARLAGDIPTDLLPPGTDIDFDIPLITDVVFSYSSGKVYWTAGTLSFKGVTYNVNANSSGTTAGDGAGVYADLSSPTDPITMSVEASPSLVANRWWFALVQSSAVYPVLQSPLFHGGLIQARTITASHIATGTITANELAANSITVGDMDSTTAGRIFSSGTKKSTVEGWESGASTYIAPGKVLISGSTMLSAWSHGSDATMIDGGDIFADSVTATQINSTSLFSEDITCSGAIHSSAKTSYTDTDAGWWVGVDGGTPKLNIGDATQNLKWDGTDLYINGQKGLVGTAGNGFNLTNGTAFFSDATYGVLISDGTVAFQNAAGTTTYSSIFAGTFTINDGFDLTAYNYNSNGATFHNDLEFYHSHSDTTGTRTTSTTGEMFCSMDFFGVDTGNNWAAGGYIHVIQNGAAGASHVPTDIEIGTVNSSGTHRTFTFGNDGVLTVPTISATTYTGLPSPLCSMGRIVGDGAADQTITHNLGRTPTRVDLVRFDAGYADYHWSGSDTSYIKTVTSTTFKVASTANGASDDLIFTVS
jgi:hypothetical protein